MRKHQDIQKVQGGFSVVPTQAAADGKARRDRMKDAVKNPKANPTNKDLQDLMLDIAAELADRE